MGFRHTFIVTAIAINLLGAHATAHRRKEGQENHLYRLQQSVRRQWGSQNTHANSYEGKTLRVPDVRKKLHAARPSNGAHAFAHRRKTVRLYNL